MNNSCTTAEKAILRSTAVGHFSDPATGRHRRTDLFKLPDSWAPAGATPIGTVGDLLAFARTQLSGGVSPTGTRVLSQESTTRMRSVWHDMQTPNIPPIGLGWLLMPFGSTTVLSMSGSSPGGVAVLASLPERNFAFAAFGNGPGAMMLHDSLLLCLLDEHLGIPVPELAATSIRSPSRSRVPCMSTIASTNCSWSAVRRDLIRASGTPASATWITEKLDSIAEPEFAAIYRDYDHAFEWPADDPRLPELADRAARWLAAPSHPRTPSNGDESRRAGHDAHNPPSARSVMADNRPGPPFNPGAVSGSAPPTADRSTPQADRTDPGEQGSS